LTIYKISFNTLELILSKSFWDDFREYLNHPESKFEGDVGVLKRKHVNVARVVHVGKESNNLDETEVLGVDSDNYEIYEDSKDIDTKFKRIVVQILEMKPSDVKKYEISRQTLWNVKNKILANKTKFISNKIKTILVFTVERNIRFV
jgi:hypothetical protein